LGGIIASIRSNLEKFKCEGGGLDWIEVEGDAGSEGLVPVLEPRGVFRGGAQADLGEALAVGFAVDGFKSGTGTFEALGEGVAGLVEEDFADLGYKFFGAFLCKAFE
jgi:hypothetical protein